MSDRVLIPVTSDELKKLRKHRRMSGRDFIIEVVDRSASDIRLFGRRNHKRR